MLNIYRKNRKKVLQVVSGWQAVELILQCTVYGLWKLLQVAVKRLWKGHCRKSVKNSKAVELSVDCSVGTHCYIKILGVKYHYVETGPKSGQLVLILGDAPDSRNQWSPSWAGFIKRLAEEGYHVITLDLRGTGGSEGGSRSDLSPPRAVEELSTLLEALEVSDSRPAVIIGLGIGGMLAWYLVHCYGSLVGKLAVVGAPHPNLYWQHSPASFYRDTLYFIQWPHFPEQFLAEGALQDSDGAWSSSRACDWSAALNYLRGAAWWRINPSSRCNSPALLIGAKDSASQLVASAQYCVASTLRIVPKPNATDKEVANVLIDFLIAKDRLKEEEPRGLVGRMLGAATAVAGRGRELTARLVLPPMQA